ncbi:MAG TPA: CBO0543 family protein [Selenomonadales bacterium]|nr:CBO0543 family protein [Selenomonadales bacterium]
MSFTVDQWIMLSSAVVALILLIFAVDWSHFRDWVVILLFKSLLDFIWGSPVVELKLIEYPVRLLPHYYDTAILFELWVFPVLCVLYNQVTRKRGLGAILLFAILFSAGITAIEYILERYTALIHYLDWTWFTSFYTLTITFLLSRAFIAFFRWGCDHFGGKQRIR